MDDVEELRSAEKCIEPSIINKMIYQQPLIQGHQLSQILKDDLDPRIIFQDSVDILGMKMLGRVIRI